MPRMKNKARSDGRLQSKVYIGDGKYKYVYAATQKELAEKVQEIKLLMGKGIDLEAQDDTFGYWSDRWISLKKMDISDKRWRAYNSRRKYLDPLRNMPIVKMKPADIQDIIIEAATTPCEKTGEPLARQTLIEIKNIANQIFKLAIENRVMDYNPAEYVKIPKTAQETVREPLTAEQQRWVREFPHRAQTAAMIMMFAGLRRGELLALQWSDIDLKNGTISVNKSVEMVGNVPKVKSTAKTESGIRIVYIPSALIEYLEKQPHENLLVVCQKNGKLHTETSWKKMWESYMKSLNVEYGDFEHNVAWMKKHNSRPKSKCIPEKIPMLIPEFTAHQLRHTYITMLYYAGVDVMTAKEQAGHADIQTTLGIYTHLDKEHKQKNIDKLNKYIADGCQHGCQKSSETA